MGGLCAGTEVMGIITARLSDITRRPRMAVRRLVPRRLVTDAVLARMDCRCRAYGVHFMGVP